MRTHFFFFFCILMWIKSNWRFSFSCSQLREAWRIQVSNQNMCKVGLLDLCFAPAVQTLTGTFLLVMSDSSSLRLSLETFSSWSKINDSCEEVFSWEFLQEQSELFNPSHTWLSAVVTHCVLASSSVVWLQSLRNWVFFFVFFLFWFLAFFVT